MEDRFGGWGEKADIKIGVEKEGGNTGVKKNIVEFIGGRSLPLQRFLELAVEGGKLLVERLQFLFRRQQLLVRRLVFLAVGQCFFVDLFLLFVQNLKVADSALELGSCCFEFLFELDDPWNVSRSGRAAPGALRFWLVNEANQQQILAFAQNR